MDNDESLLDVTDLVFIDPVTTGYSRAVPGEDPKKFHGLAEDVESVGEFIRLWTGRFGRWSSPKFLAGESYGTTRAAAPLQPPAGAARDVPQRHHPGLLDPQLPDRPLRRRQRPALPALPAHLHRHRLVPQAACRQDLQAAGLQKAVAEAERFALGEYTLALAQGNDLPAGAVEATSPARSPATPACRADFVERTNLRPEIQRLRTRSCCGTSGRRSGGSTAASRGWTATPAGGRFEFDPSYAAIQGPFTAVLNDYVRQDLGFKSDLPYEILTDRVRPWSYGESDNQYVNVAEDLRSAMAQNPALQGLRRQRLLRPRDALLRHRVHLRPPRLRARLRAPGHHDATTRPAT